MKKDRILSSTLSDLVGKYFQQDVIAEMEKRYQSAPARLIPITQIDDTEFVKEVVLPEATIEYFASGLRERGFYNPLAVRKKADGRYEIILGRKRFFGAKRAGILSLPCVIVDCSEEEELLMLLADTRDQREGNVVEMALLCEELRKRYGYTQKTLAELSHQSRCQIANTVRILRLPQDAIDKLCLGELSYGHAKAIASLPEPKMREVLERIEKENLSVRECESLVRTIGKQGKEEGESLGKRVGESVGAEVSVRRGSPEVSLRFDSVEKRDEFLVYSESNFKK